MPQSLLKTLLEDFKRNKNTIFQTSTLFGSKIGVIALGLLIKAIQTRALTPDLYGLYIFFSTITGLTVLFFRFGYFASLKVLLANNNDQQKEKEFFGIGISVGGLIGIAYGVFIFIISFFINDLFDIQFGHQLRVLAPLCIIFPLQHLLEDLAIGSNRVNQLASFNLGSKVLFILPLVTIFLIGELTLSKVLWFNLISSALALFFVLNRLNPAFTNLKSRFKELRDKHQSYGKHYYYGNVANQSTYKLDEVAISLFINTTQLGFYNLANMVCTPMVLMSQALTSSMFKRFASEERIPYKVFIYNTLWLLLSWGILITISGFLVSFIFGSDYMIVAKFIVPLSLAHFLQGLYQPFTFLAVKSKGEAIRNVAWGESIINIVGNFTLIFIFGIYGVILTSILAKLFHAIGLYYYYRKYFGALNV